MARRPSFQFYPADWTIDLSLRNCSFAARGLWIDMMCLMHQGTPYGYLKVGGKIGDDGEMKGGEPLTSSRLAHILGADLKMINRLINELEVMNIFSRDIDGAIYSRRMVKDEEIRIKRALGGIKSIQHPNTHKPKLDDIKSNKGTLMGTLRVTHEGCNSVPPPSSSSSSSSVKLKDKPPLSPLLPEWLPSQTWNDFIDFRKQIKKPATKRAQELIIKKLEKFKNEGQNIEDVLNQSIVKGWQDVFAIVDYYQAEGKNGSGNKQTHANNRYKTQREKDADISELMFHHAGFSRNENIIDVENDLSAEVQKLLPDS